MSRLRSLFWLCVLLVAAYLGWQMLPAYVANYQFQDAIDTESRLAGVNEKLSEEEIRQRVMRQARSLSIPVQAEQVKVRREGQDVVIWADYKIHFDLPVHPVDVEFHPASRNKRR